MRRLTMLAVALGFVMAFGTSGYAQTPSGDKMEKDKMTEKGKMMDKKDDKMMEKGKMMDKKDDKMMDKKDDKMMDKKQ